MSAVEGALAPGAALAEASRSTIASGPTAWSCPWRPGTSSAGRRRRAAEVDRQIGGGSSAPVPAWRALSSAGGQVDRRRCSRCRAARAPRSRGRVDAGLGVSNSWRLWSIDAGARRRARPARRPDDCCLNSGPVRVVLRYVTPSTAISSPRRPSSPGAANVACAAVLARSTSTLAVVPVRSRPAPPTPRQRRSAGSRPPRLDVDALGLAGVGHCGREAALDGRRGGRRRRVAVDERKVSVDRGQEGPRSEDRVMRCMPRASPATANVSNAAGSRQMPHRPAGSEWGSWSPCGSGARSAPP